jgi:poly-gamma-glutamate synthesis protein (capsule biosynthesis protein)
MASKHEKIIIAASITLLSLTAIFLLFKIAASPAAPSFSDKITTMVPSSFLRHNAGDSPKLPETKTRPTTLLFGGDVMLSRHVNDKMEKYQDYSWPFLKIADYLNSADLTIINLESPFAEAKSYFVPTGSFMFKANPAAIAGLTISGVDLITLANNHSLNQGADGINETQKILTEAGIKAIGAGENEAAAHNPAIFTVNEKRFGFLSYAYPEDNSVAAADRTGIAGMDIDKMAEDITKLKTEADVIVILMHAGEEYTTKPNKQQIAFAHAAIDSGADLVIGHHPHWPQIWEYYQDKPIIYSLGNLIFDQMWSKETSLGLTVELSWDSGWQEIKFVPIKIRDYGQAEILEDGSEKDALFKNLGIPADGKIKSAPQS